MWGILIAVNQEITWPHGRIYWTNIAKLSGSAWDYLVLSLPEAAVKRMSCEQQIP